MLVFRQLRSLACLWRLLAPEGVRRLVPLLGSIVAGRPEASEATVDQCLEVDADLLQLPKNARTFALKVQGDSMKNAGIFNGDFVVMEFRDAKHGDVVAASIDGETTLKRYVVQEGRPYLRAANPRFPDLIPAHELLIQGVMVALIRLPVR